MSELCSLPLAVAGRESSLGAGEKRNAPHRQSPQPHLRVPTRVEFAGNGARIRHMSRKLILTPCWRARARGRNRSWVTAEICWWRIATDWSWTRKCFRPTGRRNAMQRWWCGRFRGPSQWRWAATKGSTPSGSWRSVVICGWRRTWRQTTDDAVAARLMVVLRDTSAMPSARERGSESNCGKLSCFLGFLPFFWRPKQPWNEVRGWRPRRDL